MMPLTNPLPTPSTHTCPSKRKPAPSSRMASPSSSPAVSDRITPSNPAQSPSAIGPSHPQPGSDADTIPDPRPTASTSQHKPLNGTAQGRPAKPAPNTPTRPEASEEALAHMTPVLRHPNRATPDVPTLTSIKRGRTARAGRQTSASTNPGASTPSMAPTILGASTPSTRRLRCEQAPDLARPNTNGPLATAQKPHRADAQVTPPPKALPSFHAAVSWALAAWNEQTTNSTDPTTGRNNSLPTRQEHPNSEAREAPTFRAGVSWARVTSNRQSAKPDGHHSNTCKPTLAAVERRSAATSNSFTIRAGVSWARRASTEQGTSDVRVLVAGTSEPGAG